MNVVHRAALAVATSFVLACGSAPSVPDGGQPPDAGQDADAGQTPDSGTDPCKGASVVALAGPAQAAAKHATVTLDGSATGSRGAVTYAWRLEAIPAGSAVSLSSATAARPTFTADVAGVYVAALFVTDTCGTPAPATTVVTVANRAPVASAGPDQHAMPGDTVTLDAGNSTDPDQDALSYSWLLVARPAGSTASLSSATAKAPKLVPDLYGTYVALLTVSDGVATSAPVAVAVQAGFTGPSGTCTPAAPPIAAAGRDVTISYNSLVQLDGSGSNSGRGTPLTYKWTLSSMPSGATATFDNAAVVRPGFYPSRPGVYVATLVVNDGCTDSTPSSVKVTRLNNPPNAYIPYYGQTNVPILLPLALQASAYDSDGDPLTYRWQLVSAPAGSRAALSDLAAVQPSLTPDLAGAYVVSLVVNDGTASSNPATALITAANLPPVAQVGADQTAGTGATVTLDGSASADPSKRALTFSWMLQAPAGSATTLTGATTAKPTFVADATGIYRAQLTVGAGGFSSQATSFVAVWPAVARLVHRVLDAQYSSSLDRVIVVAADPNALYLLDPVTRVETTVPLSQTPSSVSLSADGKFAAVGHANAVSYVNLATAAVSQVVPIMGDVAKVVLGDNGVIYAFPRAPQSDHVRILAQALAGGLQTSVTSSLTGAPRPRLRFGSSSLYLTTDFGYYGYTLEKYALDGSTPAVVATANVSSCGDLWLSEAGTRLFTRCATLLRASSSSLEDLLSIGSLARPAYTTLLLRHLSDSTAASEISAVASADSTYTATPDDRTLRRWDANGLAARESVRFPLEKIGASSFQWNGRFVFYRSDGSERYVLLQLDPTAGALQEFGIATF